jgi:hypothetical protein
MRIEPFVTNLKSLVLRFVGDQFDVVTESQNPRFNNKRLQSISREPTSGADSS